MVCYTYCWCHRGNYVGLVLERGGIKMGNFKVGDKVYFRLHDASYIIKSGTITRFMDYHKAKHAVVPCDKSGEYLLLPERLYHT